MQKGVKRMKALFKKILKLILAAGILSAAAGAFPAAAAAESPVITAPADGSVLEAGQSVAIVVDAGTAADRVEFYINGELLGESTESGDPLHTGVSTYRYAWTPEEAGTYSLNARVYADSDVQETVPVKIYAEVSAALGTRGTQFENMTLSEGNVVSQPNVSGHWLTKPDTVIFYEAQVDTAHGKSLQMTSTAASISGNTAFLNIDGIGGAAGDITVAEFEVRFSKPAMGCYAGFHDGNTFAANFTMSNGSFPEAAGGTYDANTWYQIRLIFNTKTGQYDAYVNGEQRISGMTTTLERLNRIKWEFRQDASASEQDGANITYLDNFRFATLQIPPSLTGIDVVNSSGTVMSDPVDAAEAAAIWANFDNDLQNVNAESVTLYKGDGETAVIPVTVSLEGGTRIVVTPQLPLESSGLYRLVLRDTISGSSGIPIVETEYVFHTASGTLGVQNGRFTNGSGDIADITALNAGDTVWFRAEGAAAADEEVYVLTALYRDGQMMEYTVEQTTLSGLQTLAGQGLTLTEAPQEGDVLCGYVWRSGLRPMGTGFVLH